MFEYINTKTGARISSPDILSGENWITYDGKEKIEEGSTESVIEEPIEENPAEEDSALDGITKKQIEQELQALGIEYDPKAKKADLYKLMQEA